VLAEEHHHPSQRSGKLGPRGGCSPASLAVIFETKQAEADQSIYLRVDAAVGNYASHLCEFWACPSSVWGPRSEDSFEQFAPWPGAEDPVPIREELRPSTLKSVRHTK
jgi:hypothetical protein